VKRSSQEKKIKQKTPRKIPWSFLSYLYALAFQKGEKFFSSAESERIFSENENISCLGVYKDIPVILILSQPHKKLARSFLKDVKKILKRC
jgi:hypothetical protein